MLKGYNISCLYFTQNGLNLCHPLLLSLPNANNPAVSHSQLGFPASLQNGFQGANEQTQFANSRFRLNSMFLTTDLKNQNNAEMKKKCWVRKGRKRGVRMEPEEQGKQYFASEDDKKF